MLDGNGKTVSNFTIDCRGGEYGGFFGCTKNARVANLALDYILRGKGGVTVGGMAGSIIGGSFENCQVRLAMSTGMCSGGFCGKNFGTIRNCYVGGKISPPVPILPWLIPVLAVLLVLLITGSVMLIKKLTGNVPLRFWRRLRQLSARLFSSFAWSRELLIKTKRRESRKISLQSRAMWNTGRRTSAR